MADRYPVPVGPASLRGRGPECALLAEMTAAVREGESRTLVVRGEAGVGKTALLNHAVESASDLRVLRAAGVESEMELAFASVHQLCAPLLDHLGKVPAPQREALKIAFGTSEGLAPDRFFVGLAVLSLLSDAAAERPLLCVVDDAQWLDQASAQTLTFVARRLFADPVGLVFAAREPGAELRGLPELDVQGLPSGDARALLASVLRFPLDERVRDRIVAETRGNPLALLELPRGMTATQLAGGFGLVGAAPLSGRIEESFVRRIEALPDDTRSLLLVAAAEPVGDSLVVWRAAEVLGIEASAAVAPETEGLLAINDLVRFRHPLVRSAAYRAASPQERRAAHRALAEVTDPQVDPDRRAWHLAAAASGPDEAVAVELELSAGRAQSRGGMAASAAFLRRSVALTRDPVRRAERALAAAEASFRAGAFDAALGLAATAKAGAALDEFQQARVSLVRGHVAFASGFGSSDAPQLLLTAARRFESFDLQLARETYLTAWGAAVFDEQGDVLLEVCRAVRALPPPRGTPRPLDLLLDGLALLTTDGRAAATPTLQRAASALAYMPVEDVLRWGWVANEAGYAVWADEGVLAIAARHVHLVRDAGALAELPVHLIALGIASAWIGDFASVAASIAEAESVATAIGSSIAPYTALRLAALRGREAEASALIASAIEQAAAGGQRLAATQAHWAAAVLYNGLARYEEAAAAARQASNTIEPCVSMWALVELVEAAARGGNPS